MSDWKLDRQNAYVPDVIPDSDLAMYRKANFGHPIGWGRKVGIVVVDMTRAFVEDGFALGNAKMGQAALRGIARADPEEERRCPIGSSTVRTPTSRTSSPTATSPCTARRTSATRSVGDARWVSSSST